MHLKRRPTVRPEGVAKGRFHREQVTHHVNHRMPGKECTCASSVFEPYIIVRIPLTEKPVGFEIESEPHDCG